MTKLTLINQTDLENSKNGLLPEDRVRSVVVAALVDTGATSMMLPADVCSKIGLPVYGARSVRYASGSVEEVPWVGGLLIEILGRRMSCGALVGPAGTTPLIGQIQLEELDLLVDAKTRELCVNPASPDMPLLDLLAVQGARSAP